MQKPGTVGHRGFHWSRARKDNRRIRSRVLENHLDRLTPAPTSKCPLLNWPGFRLKPVGWTRDGSYAPAARKAHFELPATTTERGRPIEASRLSPMAA